MMANISKINGFKAVKHITGAPYNGQANIYTVKSGTKLVPGDLVKLTGGASQNGIAEVDAATNDAAVLGAVVGVVPAKMDPVTGKMSNGSITLDTPVSVTGGSTPAYVLVADDPGVIYEVQKASFTATDVGTSGGFDFAGTAGGDATTGGSNMYLTDTATGVIQVLGLVPRVNNETGNYAKVYARITNSNYAL
jgi:hypothetical protein